MYGLSINFCCCSTIKTPPIFDIYILPNIGGIFYFFSALGNRKGVCCLDLIISFLATAIIAYASCLFKIHIFYFWLFLAYKLSTIFYFFIIVLLLYNRDIKSGLCAQTRASSLAGGMPVW